MVVELFCSAIFVSRLSSVGIFDGYDVFVSMYVNTVPTYALSLLFFFLLFVFVMDVYRYENISVVDRRAHVCRLYKVT